MPKHTKLKVEIVKDIIEDSNSKSYLVGEIIEVQEIKKESDYFQVIFKTDTDMIPKDCVVVLHGKQS